MERVALAAYGAELVALGNGLSQRIERGHPKRTLEGELRKPAMMGHGKPPCCRDWRRQREVRGTPGHRTATRPACRTAGAPMYAVHWGDRRSEERRVGHEWGRTCSSRWTPPPYKTKNKNPHDP